MVAYLIMGFFTPLILLFWFFFPLLSFILPFVFFFFIETMEIRNSFKNFRMQQLLLKACNKVLDEYTLYIGGNTRFLATLLL